MGGLKECVHRMVSALESRAIRILCPKSPGKNMYVGEYQGGGAFCKITESSGKGEASGKVSEINKPQMPHSLNNKFHLRISFL